MLHVAKNPLKRKVFAKSVFAVMNFVAVLAIIIYRASPSKSSSLSTRSREISRTQYPDTKFSFSSYCHSCLSTESSLLCRQTFDNCTSEKGLLQTFQSLPIVLISSSLTSCARTVAVSDQESIICNGLQTLRACQLMSVLQRCAVTNEYIVLIAGITVSFAHDLEAAFNQYVVRKSDNEKSRGRDITSRTYNLRKAKRVKGTSSQISASESKFKQTFSRHPARQESSISNLSKFEFDVKLNSQLRSLNDCSYLLQANRSDNNSTEDFNTMSSLETDLVHQNPHPCIPRPSVSSTPLISTVISVSSFSLPLSVSPASSVPSVSSIYSVPSVSSVHSFPSSPSISFPPSIANIGPFKISMAAEITIFGPNLSRSQVIDRAIKKLKETKDFEDFFSVTIKTVKRGQNKFAYIVRFKV